MTTKQSIKFIVRLLEKQPGTYKHTEYKLSGNVDLDDSIVSNARTKANTPVVFESSEDYDSLEANHPNLKVQKKIASIIRAKWLDGKYYNRKFQANNKKFWMHILTA